jgi:hypothetical protein
MANDDKGKVEESADGVDMGEIARELGLPVKPDPEPEQAPENEPSEPDEATDPEPEETAGEEDQAEEDEKESEAEADKDGKGDKPDPDHVQRRIDKLTAQKLEAIEKLQTAEAELAEVKAKADAKPPVVVVDPENPLSSFTDVDSLRAAVAKAQAALDWAEENREGGEITVNGEAKFYDAEAVKMIRRNAREAVMAAPGQERFLTEREASLAEARALYPELFREGTAEHAAMVAAVKQFPFISRVPGLELMLGDTFTGMKLRTAKLEQMQRKQAQQQRKTSPETAKVPKVPTVVSTPKGVVNKADTDRKSRFADVFKSGGSTEALEKFAESLL